MNHKQKYWKQRYWHHKSNAKRRDIPFTLTFEEWMYIWITSGKWMYYGRGKGKYVMSRVKDQGSYTIGNVFIQLNGQNVSDACKGRISPNKGKIASIETRLKMRESHLGKVRGPYKKKELSCD